MSDYNIEKLPKSRVKITITVPEKKFKSYYEAAYQKMARDVEIKGFRPGKAPRSMAESHIGPDKIFSEGLDMALPVLYAEAIEKEKLIPIEQPHVHIKEFDLKKPLTFTCEVDVLPEFKLPDYKRIKATRKKLSVSPKELVQVLENVKKSYAEVSPKKEAAQKGDKIEIDFDGFLNRVKIESLTSKNHPIVLGETKLVPGFTEKLIGMKKGEEKSFKIKMPKDVADKLISGKEVEFKVKVCEVSQIKYPEIDEKFVKKITKFKTVKEFEDNLKQSVLSQKEMDQERELQNEVVGKLIDKVKIELPDSLVNAELSRMIEDLSARIQMQGGTLEGWLSSMKKSRETLEKELRKQAEESVKTNLVISKLREESKIKVSSEEIDKEISSLKLQGQDLPEDDETKRYVGNVLGNRKVVKMLVETATK